MSLSIAPLSVRHSTPSLPSHHSRLAQSTSPRRVTVRASAVDHADSLKQGVRAKIEHGLVEAGKLAATAVLCGALALGPAEDASARLEGVNKPELLPQEFTRVIDTGGFLSQGQIRRLSEDLARLEDDTGFKLRVLSQSYPNTPGLAIREYWGVDDDTVVFVADPTFKNILNFNVGGGVDLRVPRSFWSRLAGKYGNMFYWKEKGEDAAIEAAVVAIDACLREEPGPRQCSEIR